MGIGNIGIPGLILILALTLIVFGPKKLPEIGRSLGKTLSEFKDSTTKLIDEGHDESERNQSADSAKGDKGQSN